MVNVLVIFMIVAGVRTGACPIMCTCREYPRDTFQKTTLYYTSISCEGYVQNLTRTLDNTTRDLEISNFREEELTYFFQDLSLVLSEIPYFDNLVISRSVINEYFNVSLEGLERLHSLSLPENKLDKLPEAFLNLSSLQTMDLSNNDIKVIELQPFRTLRTLEVLNLSVNSLTGIDSASFTGLTTLKCLDLSGNNLTTIDNKVLLPLTSLQYLNLSSNRLEVLNEVSFSSLVRLQQLDVSWNRLARVAPGSLQLPSLARLLLAGNPQLGGSRDAAVLVGTGRRLQTVDASRTGLKQVPAALTHSIRTLRLANNSIRTVSCGDLDSYPLLQLLDFTSNELEVIEDDALGRLDSLSILYLTDNNIVEIPKSLPEKLKVLHLEHNNINRVSGDDLQGLAALEVLLLSDNKIRVVEEAAFSQLVSLVTLDLSRNPVTILQPGCLSGPPALQVLRLASIGIISPAKEVSFPLSATEHLIILDLAGSPGLARQLLADTAALAASRELQELDLSHTDLDLIRSDLLQYLPQLRVLHIKDNRLNCTELQWLGAWMRRQNNEEYRGVSCASPPEQWGTMLIDLQDEEPKETTTQLEVTTEKLLKNNEITNEESNLPRQFVSKIVKKEKNNINKLKENTTLFEGYNTTSLNKSEVSHFLENADNKNNEVIENSNGNENFSHIAKVNNKKMPVNGMRTTLAIKNEYVIQKSGLTSESTSPYSITTLRLSNEDASTTERSQDTTIVSSESFISNHNVTASSTADTVRPEGTLKQNANEADKFPSNKLDDSKIFHDLFIATKEKTFNDTLKDNKFKELVLRDSTVTIDEKMTVNSSQWNITTGEMSMFTNNDRNVGFLHPGMLILAAGVLGAAAALAMLAARFTRKRRNSRLFYQENIEVSSLPSVTELW